MTVKRFSPKAAAQVVGIGASTVRNWAGEYAEFLSPTANPGDGQPRSFTEADLAVLQVVKELRTREALNADQVLHRLRELPAGDLQQPYIEAPEQPTESPKDTPPAHPDVQLPAVRVDVATLIDSRFATLLEQQQAMSRDIASMRSERHGALMLAAGVAIGVVVMLVAIGLVAWLLRAG